eukprot:6197070-Pleurochrysis_carterae.AAC.1
MRQLFSAYWVYNYGCVCAQTREEARVVLCAYHVLGYYVRAVAQYRATAQHVGFGENLRQLKKTEYQKDKLPMHVVNRVYRPSGRWKGIGFRGCKGKHAPAIGVPVYQPQRRRKRVSNALLLAPDNDPFIRKYSHEHPHDDNLDI